MAIPEYRTPLMYDPAKAYSGTSGFIGNLPAEKWKSQYASDEEYEVCMNNNQEERTLEHELKMEELRRCAARKQRTEDTFLDLERYWYKFCQLLLCLAGIAGFYAAVKILGMTWALL